MRVAIRLEFLNNEDTTMSETFYKKQMTMRLGEAIERHNTLHKRITSGTANEEIRAEYTLITNALNNIELDLGF